jgi:hypothetical protein
MTAQINDIFRYEGTAYAVAGISEGELFNPATFGMRPAMASTACWRGYQAVFALRDAELVLADLHVNLLQEGEGFRRKAGPAINGVPPTDIEEKSHFFNNHYEGLNLPLDYSGGLLLADGFIRELYVHMGFHPAWKYERVIELVFANGRLSNEFDRSAKMAEIRQLFRATREAEEAGETQSLEEIHAFVARAFDRSY